MLMLTDPRPEYHLRFRLLETTTHFPFTGDLDLHLFQLHNFTKTVDELSSDLDLWLYVLNNGKGLDLASLPRKLRVAEIVEALEAWDMLTRDRIQREIYEARERARRDTEDWKSALERAEERAISSEERARSSLVQGRWIGQVRVCEELLDREPRPEAELMAMSLEDLRQFAESLRAELSSR